MKRLPVLVFIILWAIWFFCYPYYHVWLEGYSFFSTLPDFRALHAVIPHGLSMYIGAFLHQFYAVPAIGAAIQAFFGVWPVICAGIIVKRLFKEPEGLMWISILPLPFVVYRQFWDLQMVYVLRYALMSGALMLAVLLITMFRRPQWTLPKFLSGRFLGIASVSACMLLSVYLLAFRDERCHLHEEYARLEYMGEHRQWQEILQTVSVQDAATDEFKRRYALLALSETGNLAEYAFRYGLSSSGDFLFYGRIEPLCLNFNALFYQCQDMHNAVIQQAYQLGVQSVTGAGSASLRKLADTYIGLKDHTLAKKYVDILSHTTCHRRWVKERLPELEAIKNAVPEYAHDPYKAVIADFPHTISSMVDRTPENRKYADLLLCSILADRDGDKFKNLFSYIAQWQYPDGRNIPRLYEEALLLISTVDPSVMEGIAVSKDTWNRFKDFADMMNSGQAARAMKKYSDTYWAYSYR